MIPVDDLPSDTERVLVPAQPSMEEAPPISKVIRLGEWLVNRSLINRSHLYEGLKLAHHQSCRLGDALVEMGVLERKRLEQEIQVLHAAIDTPKRAVPPPLPADVFQAKPPKRGRKGPPPLPADAFKTRPGAGTGRGKREMRQKGNEGEQGKAGGASSRASAPSITVEARRADDTEKDVVYYLTRRKRQD